MSTLAPVIHTVTKKETRPMIVLWVVLFALTIVFSDDLSFRSLAAAMFAWLGGIVTAEIVRTYSIIDMILRTVTKRDDASTKP